MFRIVYPCYDVDQHLMCIVSYIHVMMSIGYNALSIVYPCYYVDQDLMCIVSYIHVMMSIRI